MNIIDNSKSICLLNTKDQNNIIILKYDEQIFTYPINIITCLFEDIKNETFVVCRDNGYKDEFYYTDDNKVEIHKMLNKIRCLMNDFYNIKK